MSIDNSCIIPVSLIETKFKSHLSPCASHFQTVMIHSIQHNSIWKPCKNEFVIQMHPQIQKSFQLQTALTDHLSFLQHNTHAQPRACGPLLCDDTDENVFLSLDTISQQVFDSICMDE